MTKTVLLVTDGIFHPPLLGRMTLRRVLKTLAPPPQPGRLGQGFAFQHIPSLEKLPGDLDQYAALVLHYHHKRISPSALSRLNAFVRAGGGILALHAATASFKQTLPYFEILGGRFIGHGEVEKYEVRRVKDSIFSGIDDFAVRDELYIHELNPNIEVHFTAKHEGKEVPVVWTHQYGAGKICYAVPGHTTEAMNNPVYQEVLKRGLAWVCEKQREVR